MIFSGELKDRVESQEEIDTIIETIFKKRKTIDETEYINCVENEKSEIFIYVIIIFEIYLKDNNIFTGEKTFFKKYIKRILK
jgi:hypothetical protein